MELPGVSAHALTDAPVFRVSLETLDPKGQMDSKVHEERW